MSLNRIVVDYIDKESDNVRIEIANTFIVLPLEMFPDNITEGSVLKFAVDECDTDSSKETIKSIQDRLFRKKPN